MELLFNLLFDFIIFSFAGYLGEVIYCGLQGNKSGKALHGPYCPLYGLGGTLILHAVKYLPRNVLIVYIVGVLIASLTEYFVSYLLEKIFNARWWDYSKKRFNLNGRICLRNSLLFGLLALILVFGYIPLKDLLLTNTNLIVIKTITYIISIVMVIDAIITVLEIKEIKIRLKIIDKYGLKDKNRISRIFNHYKPKFNYKRLLKEFNFKDEKMKFIKNYKRIKLHFKKK